MAGAICVVLVGAITYKVAGDSRQPAVPAMANVGSATPAAAAPDLSQWTPREQFDRLFNRIMQAAERGDRAEVERFTPMAIGAYSKLDVIDADARYHAAVLHLQADNAPAALALADTILATSPGHLFGYLIRGTAAQLRNDSAARRQAQRDFLAHYDAELGANRAEYGDHGPVIEEFKTEAEAETR